MGARRSSRIGSLANGVVIARRRYDDDARHARLSHRRAMRLPAAYAGRH
jgi:hypothetical protein